MSEDAVVKKGSALSALKAMTKKEKVSSESEFATTVNDVAIKGAKRVRTTVQLGLDVEFCETAKRAAELHQEMEQAKSKFEIVQAQVRDYGSKKRLIWNDTFKCNDTTVAIPYEIDTPNGEKERHFVQCVVTNKYSVRKETIEQIRGDLGDSFDRLFEEEREKVLRPNCAELFRGLLVEAGMDESDVEDAMNQLFEEKVSIKTTKNYEQEVKRVSDGLRSILDQAVTRSQPALKFEG
jgi:hypothetical protein